MQVDGTVATGWTATSSDGAVAGRATLWVRPDGRQFLLLSEDATRRARHALLGAVPPQVEGELWSAVRPGAQRLRQRLDEHGFVPVRTVDRIEVDVAVAHAALTSSPLPTTRLVGVATVGLDALRRLDEELRADVPGTEGWRWTPEDFAEETFGPGHDDRLYRVAVADDEPLGLVRVRAWQDGHRIGLVGVRRPHRRRGVARALLADVLGALVERGVTVVEADVARGNAAVHGLLARIAPRVTASELVHVRPTLPPPDASPLST